MATSIKRWSRKRMNGHRDCNEASSRRLALRGQLVEQELEFTVRYHYYITLVVWPQCR